MLGTKIDILKNQDIFGQWREMNLKKSEHSDNFKLLDDRDWMIVIEQNYDRYLEISSTS